MKTRILMFFAIASMGIAGCSDPCDSVNCLNGGVCNDGNCICLDGFTGEFCQSVVIPTDPCDDVNCGSNGICDNGTCLCFDGYTGEFCEQANGDLFIASYLVNENCQGNTDTYTMTITPNGAGGQYVNVTNLYDAGHTVVGTVSGTSIVIASQTVNGYTYSGSGTMSGNTLTMAFTISAGGDSVNCNITANKM